MINRDKIESNLQSQMYVEHAPNPRSPASSGTQKVACSCPLSTLQNNFCRKILPIYFLRKGTSLWCPCRRKENRSYSGAVMANKLASRSQIGNPRASLTNRIPLPDAIAANIDKWKKINALKIVSRKTIRHPPTWHLPRKCALKRNLTYRNGHQSLRAVQ